MAPLMVRMDHTGGFFFLVFCLITESPLDISRLGPNLGTASWERRMFVSLVGWERIAFGQGNCFAEWS